VEQFNPHFEAFSSHAGNNLWYLKKRWKTMTRALVTL